MAKRGRPSRLNNVAVMLARPAEGKRHPCMERWEVHKSSGYASLGRQVKKGRASQPASQPASQQVSPHSPHA
eukprot:659459-Pelagomonas_calceolata.AAC.7